ncbi:hypothetical protein [Mucilaginibacter lacusdianchii]|uniref:hypothetical protein n=1 Tax=Mucilaginibacter lacusdianchii TaxID=2684211 RepID=UPI00131CB066|nr:hypothetical protein [Mucilaginibacter sp. JXJ CY 39]
MKSIRKSTEAPILAMDAMVNYDDITSHAVSKTPVDESVCPYPISRQNYKVVYKKDAAGYWSFVQCDAEEVN